MRQEQWYLAIRDSVVISSLMHVSIKIGGPSTLPAPYGLIADGVMALCWLFLSLLPWMYYLRLRRAR